MTVANTAFRIHKSLLSKHSDVFADLFTVPQPQDSTETIDGCPVIHLPDALPDFIDVMKALYHPFHFDSLTPEANLSTLISFVSGVLRISTKYNIQLLRQKCITVLRTKFPSILTGCDALLASGYQYTPPAIVRAIPLARETNVPEILPWAFYISTHIAMDDLLADSVLSWRDKALCLAGKERLWEVQKTLTHPFRFESVRALNCNACQLKPPQLADWREMEELRKTPHPLEIYSKWSSMKVCQKCLAQMESQHQAGREKVWKALPSIFELGSWEDIHKDQNR